MRHWRDFSLKRTAADLVRRRFIAAGGARYGVVSIIRLLQIEVSFVKEAYKRDDMLQKRPIILSSLLIIAPP